MIALWSTSTDTTADLVEQGIRSSNFEVVRVDTDLYGERYQVSWRDNTPAIVDESGKIFEVSEISSVYYRRPTISEVARSERDFALHEAWYYTRAVLLQADQAQWMNHPRALLESENKIRQLQLASSLGFLVPEGILTSSPVDAFAFYEQSDRKCVCKPGYAGLVQTSDLDVSVYAWRLPRNLSLADFQSVAASPTFLQREVPKTSDIRLTFVGGCTLAARVVTDTTNVLDWRTEIGGEIRYEPVIASTEISRKIESMMNTLQLSFGAFDFAETPNGDWHFLEVNPAGQFEWIEHETGLAISGEIARWLTLT